MKKYMCTFSGRQKGAIGIFHRCSDVVEAENPEQAREKLYDKWEHISGLRVEELPTHE